MASGAAAAAATLGTAWGTVLTARPQLVLRGLSGPPADGTEQTVAKVLGGRQLVQAAAVARWPSVAGRVGAAADLLHALTMAALATSPRYRRVAATSGAVAVVLAALELRGARS
ncbi:MAG TPA: hypothetical protein VHO27_09810 [Angustibacter sp.]|nr:hypothetical protein [Angustibacter sp.]